MKFIVPIQILRAAVVAQAKDDIRYYLNGIHFRRNCVESTNGHVAYMATIKDEIPNWFDGDRKYPDVIISIEGKIPATTKKNNIQYAVFQDDGDGVIIRYMSFEGRQLDVGMGEIKEGKFPNIPKLTSDTRRKPKSSEAIGVNVNYLSMLEKMLQGQKWSTAKLEVFGENAAMIFEMIRPSVKCKEIFLLMPVRL